MQNPYQMYIICAWCRTFDPRDRPTVTADSDHCFCTCRPFVQKQNKFQTEAMIANGETVGLAEWIIDDTCLVTSYYCQGHWLCTINCC